MTIALDGGEAARAAATGVADFRWCPDGRSPVRELGVAAVEGHAGAGGADEARKDRKETAYATSEAQYRAS
ncbi:MAG: hypothetical protein U1F49_19165 [Rubrivivax sp.]